MKYLILIFMLPLISCSSLTKEDCQKTNWKQQGFKDGAKGEGQAEYSNYWEQCREHGVSINKSEYIEGYQAGLKKYCNYKSGYELGGVGGDPLSECDKINPSFARGYEEGFRQYQQAKKEQEDRARLRNQQEEDKRIAIQNIINRNHGRSCTSHSDCQKEGYCTFNKCQHNGMSCSYNSDCKVQGNCRGQTEYVPSVGGYVEARVCEF